MSVKWIITVPTEITKYKTRYVQNVFNVSIQTNNAKIKDNLSRVYGLQYNNNESNYVCLA